MFKKKKLNLEELTVEEMRILHSRSMKRILWLNGLWLVLVVFVLFWKTRAGIFLMVITAVKYVYDYHDVESQAHNVNFVVEIVRKDVTGRMKDD